MRLSRFSTALLAAAYLFALNSEIAFAKTKSVPTKLVCVIKGNISSKHEKIYHLPGCASYNATIISPSKGERMFCTEKEAKAAGWRKALNCPK